MRRPRFEACRALGLLAGALILMIAAFAVAPWSSPAGAAAKGKIVLAWHAGFASRWLDPQEHDGTATPDNFFTALHDALIKNQGTQLYDHPALAERFAVAADAKSATFTLRKPRLFEMCDKIADIGWNYNVQTRADMVDEETLIKMKAANFGNLAFGSESFNDEILENVVLAPHLGSATTETRTSMADLAVSNAIAVLEGKPPLTPVA